MKKLFKKIGHFFSVVWIRFRTESPKFFHNLFRVCVSIFLAAEFLYPALIDLSADLVRYEVTPPMWLNAVIRFVGAMSAGAAFVAKLNVKWGHLSEKEQQILDNPPK